MRELIEADWLQHGGDFALAQTKAVLERGHALAARLRRKPMRPNWKRSRC